MTEANRYKLGFFVITGILILIVGLFFIGLRQMFEPKIELCTIFAESVQGLESGSPVKFNGVPIGKVTRVMLRPKEKSVRVNMDLNINAFDQDPNSADFIFYSRGRLQEEIDRGLRAQMEFLGITGLKYIELTYLQSNELDTAYLSMPKEMPYDLFYIPSQASLISGIKTSVVDLLTQAQVAVNRFNKLDFEKVNAVATASESTLSGIRELVRNETPNITALIQSSSKTAETLTRFIQTLDTQVVGFELKPKLENLNRTVSELRSASMAVIRSKDDAAALMRQLNETVRSLNELIQSLDETPAMLIRGRTPVLPRTLPSEKDPND